jgi:hypothetical protein
LKKRRRRHTCGYLQRRGPEAGLDVPVSCQAARKRAFFEFSLCLSRACLGKKMTFICKWLKSPFSHRYLRAETGEPASEVLMHGTDSQKYEIECSGKGGDHSPCSRGGGRSERSPCFKVQTHPCTERCMAAQCVLLAICCIGALLSLPRYSGKDRIFR